MSRTIIGIDPATQTGWAVLAHDGAYIDSGSVSFSFDARHEGGGMRYVRAGRFFAALVAKYPGCLVVYERVDRHRGTAAAHVYGGIIAELQRVCEEARAPYRGIPVAHVKQAATGKGKAGKKEMIAAVAKRWDVVVADDNEADALWVAETERLEAS